MELKIRQGRRTAQYDPTAFARRLRSEFGLSRELAGVVARQLPRDLAEDGVSSASQDELRSAAVRLALGIVTPVAVPGVVAQSTGVGTAVDAAGVLAQVVRAAAERSGFVPDGPGSFIKERNVVSGGLLGDADAPDIVDVTYRDGGCCTTAAVKGLQLDIAVRVRDVSGKLRNNSGVRRVTVGLLGATGNLSTLDYSKEVELSDDEEKRTEDSSTVVSTQLCVPCSLISGGTVTLVVRATDDAGNERITLTRKVISQATLEKCCGTP